MQVEHRWQRYGGRVGAMLAALVALLWCMGPATAQSLAPERFITVSGPASPRVAYALSRDAKALTVVVQVATFTADGTSATVALGVSAGKTQLLSDKDATVTRGKGTAEYRFTIPQQALAASEAEWKRLRLGLAVSWAGGALGEDRQRERFLHLRKAAAHQGLSPNPADWMPIDLVEYERQVTDRRNRIELTFTQPLDGKASIVIEDANGTRLRNLVSGQPFAKGTHRVSWDGLDEKGIVVKPGTYRWRAIHHPGITPEYLFSFCNDGTPPWRTGSGRDMWGPDHSNLSAAVAGKDWTFLAGTVAESGYAMVAVDAQGIKQQHYNAIHGTGLRRVMLAADDKYLYAAHDGFAWGVKFDAADPKAKAPQVLSVTRYDIKSGSVVDFPNRQRFATVSAMEVGPGAQEKDWQTISLGGLAALNGKLYLANRRANAIWVLDATSGERTGAFPLEAPGALLVYRGELLAISAGKVVRITPADGKVTPLIADPALQPAALAADAQGQIYLSDAKSSTVRVFSPAGQPVKTIGKPGGAYAGAYDPERMVNPRGLAVAANGWLWVTEDRGDPKRVVAWDLATGKVVKEKFGPTAYGASGAGFDAQDHTRWIGQGALWSLDFATKTARCISILGASTARGHKFYRQDGRTFIIGAAKATSISELLPDGSLKNLAMLAATHQFCYYFGWKPPQAFIEAFNQAYPTKIGKHAEKGPGVLWVDRNGDGDFQVDEFEFSTAAQDFAGSGWSHDFADLTMCVPARVQGKTVLVTLKPDGYYPGGAPKYPRLNDACLAGVPINLNIPGLETTVDRFGNVIANSDPEMKSFTPDGALRWTFPNRWTGVHGSHAAPLPEVGVLQGALFFLGIAPLDDQTDVFMMNGNHGRFFAMTSDGMYLDEMFKDVRTGSTVDAYLIGGECFGGVFGKSEKDGQYYLQSGHTDYRIFRINGLRDVRRTQGTLTVSAEQAAAAESMRMRQVAETQPNKEARVTMANAPVQVDGKDTEWATTPTVSWDKSRQYPVQVRMMYDQEKLYLYYLVDDPSPWVNNGKDWTTLFKTGDSINLELGTDPTANPKRSGPVPGDLRLLIAPFAGKPLVVLYRHRVIGAKEPVQFVSPWRAETVDVVKKLDTATVAVVKEANRYRLEAAIPLAELGLAQPTGKTMKADVGVIYGDAEGAINMLRSYWSNQHTNLVNDVPGEIMLTPNLWGTITFVGREN